MIRPVRRDLWCLVTFLTVGTLFLFYSPSTVSMFLLYTAFPLPQPSSLNELVSPEQFPNVPEDRMDCVPYAPGRGDYWDRGIGQMAKHIWKQVYFNNDHLGDDKRTNLPSLFVSLSVYLTSVKK